MNEYKIGKCKNCNQCKALKNNICANCEDDLKNLDNNKIINDLFGRIFTDKRE